MPLKIVTGGTTGAADGTAVSQGGAFTNPLVIVALNTAVDAHIRCDDGYWSADQSFDVPTGFEVSFDGGSTWYDNADEPITAPELYAVNVPIKIRQTTAAPSASGSFTTDGTYTAIAALGQVVGLTATARSTTQIDLSWTALANRTYYKIERATDSGFTANLTVLSSTATATTYSDTGRTPATTYYYRVTGLGTNRYSNGTASASANATTTATTATFSIPAGSSDAFRRLNGSAFALDGNAFGTWNAVGRYDGTYNKYGCGLRFASVTIPAGATITAASFTGQAASSGAGANPKSRIRAQAADNPGVFTDQTDFDSRILTTGAVDAAKVTAAVAWDDMSTWTAGTSYTSPDISSVIQAIVNRGGWASGNAIVLFWDDFDGRTTTDGGYRILRDYEQGNPPTLNVSYFP